MVILLVTDDSRVVSRCWRDRNMTRRWKVVVRCYDEAFAAIMSGMCDTCTIRKAEDMGCKRSEVKGVNQGNTGGGLFAFGLAAGWTASRSARTVTLGRPQPIKPEGHLGSRRCLLVKRPGNERGWKGSPLFWFSTPLLILLSVEIYIFLPGHMRILLLPTRTRQMLFEILLFRSKNGSI